MLPFQFQDSLPMYFMVNPSAGVFSLGVRKIENAVSMELIIFPLSNIFVAILVHHCSLSMPLIIYIPFTIVRSWLITLAYVNFLGVFVWWNIKQIKYVLLYFLKLIFGKVCCGLGVGEENGTMNWLNFLERLIIHFELSICSEYCSQQNPSLNVFRFLSVLSRCKNSDVGFRKQIP